MTVAEPITSVEAWKCVVDLPEAFQLGDLTVSRRDYVVVRVETASGFSGISFGLGRGAPIDPIVTELLAPHLIGVDVLDSETLWRTARSRLPQHAIEGLFLRALSQCDIASWDVRGKVHRRPVWQLLGDARQTTASPADVLYGHVCATVGARPEAWPGGYPDNVEAALLDAVFSVRARYGDPIRRTGVIGVVDRWLAHRGDASDDLRALATVEPQLLRSLTNGGKIAGRTKADIVIDAAQHLVAAGVVSAHDLRSHDEIARSAYLQTKGCGYVTWHYLRMLVGQPDVKPDTWILRYVGGVLPEVTAPRETKRLLGHVAQRLGVDQRDLDHAIWLYAQRSARTSPRP